MCRPVCVPVRRAAAVSYTHLNQGFKSVVPKTEIGTPFVYFFLKNTLPVIEGMASGSTFKEVSGSTMKNVPAVIPDAETLAKFSDFCAPIFAQPVSYTHLKYSVHPH